MADDLIFADEPEAPSLASVKPVAQNAFEFEAIVQAEGQQVPWTTHPVSVVKAGPAEIKQVAEPVDEVAELKRQIAELKQAAPAPEPVAEVVLPRDEPLSRKEEIALLIAGDVKRIGRGLSSDETEEIILKVDTYREARRVQGGEFRPNKPEKPIVLQQQNPFPNKPPKAPAKKGWTR